MSTARDPVQHDHIAKRAGSRDTAGGESSDGANCAMADGRHEGHTVSRQCPIALLRHVLPRVHHPGEPDPAVSGALPAGAGRLCRGDESLRQPVAR